MMEIMNGLLIVLMAVCLYLQNKLLKRKDKEINELEENIKDIVKMNTVVKDIEEV